MAKGAQPSEGKSDIAKEGAGMAKRGGRVKGAQLTLGNTAKGGYGSGGTYSQGVWPRG